jgi:hypothetical protein
VRLYVGGSQSFVLINDGLTDTVSTASGWCKERMVPNND